LALLLGGVFVFVLLLSATAERWMSFDGDGTVCVDLDSVRTDENGYTQFKASFNCPGNVHIEEEAVDCRRLMATAPNARAHYMRYDAQRDVWERRLMVPNSSGRLKLEGVCRLSR
jgi:hypothetical protein